MGEAAWPIIIVTGANGGVGFGICERLLFQLCHTNPTDALPQGFTKNNCLSDMPPKYDGLTLILACRRVKRAEAAREKLLSHLDSYISTLTRKPEYDGHAHTFRKNLSIDIVSVDLAMISTVFKFAEEVSAKYPYISHLICNAGFSNFDGIDWMACFKQLVREPVTALTAPAFLRQHQGDISIDGLGWIWQCNLFGHYVLYRSIQHLLLASPPSLGSRVIWTSSLEASPQHHNLEDWQLKKSTHAYQGVKYQTDLIAAHLDYLAQKETGPRRLRHFITHPGVCSTNLSDGLVSHPLLIICKIMAFYFARICGSPHHPILPFKAAIAAVHVALASLTFITLFESRDKEIGNTTRPVKFGAQTDRWGNEYVGVLDVEDWKQHESQGDILLKKMEAVIQSIKSAEEAPMNFETASERM